MSNAQSAARMSVMSKKDMPFEVRDTVDERNLTVDQKLLLPTDNNVNMN